MPMPCSVCSDSVKAKQVAELINQGVSDAMISRQLGFSSRAGIQRHRLNHIWKPARIMLEKVGKGQEVHRERQAAIAAAQSGDLAATFLSLEVLAGDLRRTRDRLERAVTLAEAGQQLPVIGVLSNSQVRVVESAARLAGIGGYAPQKIQQGGEQTTFAVNFHFSGGRTESISTTVDAAPAPTIDMPATHINIDLPVDLGGPIVQAAPAPPQQRLSMQARWNPSRAQTLPDVDEDDDE